MKRYKWKVTRKADTLKIEEGLAWAETTLDVIQSEIQPVLESHYLKPEDVKISVVQLIKEIP